MQEQNLNEIWQVEVNGTIYEAAFSELAEWIDGGSLLPDDKIRKGNLRWIEARKVPSLVPFFNAKAAGEPMPLVVNTTVAPPPPAATPEPAAPVPNVPEPASPAAEPVSVAAALPVPGDTSVCSVHAGVESFYICDGCANGFCKACPKSYGGTVKICPACGSLCRPAVEVREAAKRAQGFSAAMDEGFGIGDLFAAFAYPFRFKWSLLFGSIFFTGFTLGSEAGGLGGIFMAAAGLISSMLGNAMTFGVLANTINNFVQGKTDEDFMPTADDFSILDDVVKPFFLSIAAYVASFGPFILVMVVAFYMVISSVSTKMDAYQRDLERIPGTNVYAGRKLAEQSDDVKDVLKGIEKKNAERLASVQSQTEQADAGAVPVDPQGQVVDEESRQQEELWAMATESRKQQLESAIGKTPETREREQAEMIRSVLNLAAPIIVIGFIALLWGLFFFPAACAVAGYSLSFTATINPLVGLDTIRRLGVDYVRILAMCAVLLFVSLLASFFFGAILAAFDLPGMGNLAAKGIGAVITFYISVVFSCILGFALFKSGDRLGLAR